jgi:hypothetical protein
MSRSEAKPVPRIASGAILDDDTLIANGVYVRMPKSTFKEIHYIPRGDTVTSFGHDMLRFWPLEPGLTYLNHGTVGVTPLPVLEAQRSIRDDIERNPSRYLLRELCQIVVGQPRAEKPRLRQAADVVGEFVGARGDDLVFVDNTTTGASCRISATAA